MDRVSLTENLKNYQSTFEEEIDYKKSFLTLLEDQDCFLRSRLAGHLTASCWVTDVPNEKILLMHHKKLNRWLQPGGHADGDENLISVAEKELQEETGLIHYSMKSSKIFDIDIHMIPQKKEIPEHFHYDVRFHFIAEKPFEIKKNNESNELKWVNLENVFNICGNEKSIMRMVEKSHQL